MNYKLTRFASYLEKGEFIAVYSNFNLIFLKNQPAVWFKKISNNEEIENVPIDFLKYLEKKEVITHD